MRPRDRRRSRRACVVSVVGLVVASGLAGVTRPAAAAARQEITIAMGSPLPRNFDPKTTPAQQQVSLSFHGNMIAAELLKRGFPAWI